MNIAAGLTIMFFDEICDAVGIADIVVGMKIGVVVFGVKVMRTQRNCSRSTNGFYCKEGCLPKSH